MGTDVLLIVKMCVQKEYDNEFNAWYDGKHIQKFIKASGCLTAKRFRAIETGDKYMYMAIYEFSDMAAFLKYDNSEAKKDLIADFVKNWSGRAEAKRDIWEQIHS
jgi:hypothetical protein